MIWRRRTSPAVSIRVKARSDFLLELDAELAKEGDLLLHELHLLPDDTRRRSRLQGDLVRVAKARAFIAPFTVKPRASIETEAEIAEILHRITQNSLCVLQSRRPSHPKERATLARIVLALTETQCQFPLSAPPAATNKVQIVFPAEILLQAQSILFPAERMLVAAGRRDGNVVRISALFDVTGDAGTGHVFSDQEALAQALVLMSKSGSHLAAWLHSHPGQGHGCTHPSNVDLQQYDDWLRCYSTALLGVISVRDGCVRLWGKALDEGRIEVEFEGNGLQKEDSNDRIYRICEE